VAHGAGFIRDPRWLNVLTWRFEYRRSGRDDFSRIETYRAVVFSRLTNKRFENWVVDYKQSPRQIFFPRFVDG
jgi:hypothetical protein